MIGEKYTHLFVTVVCLIVFNVIVVPNASAQDTPNNIIGMHLLQPSDEDLAQTAALVNGSGGDWGYVTLVIQENDRDRGRWQELFDKLRKLHLIPIVRLATQPEGGKWRRPTSEDADGWVAFLDSLNWVVKNRYVILFNEPNHGKEWGGVVDPESYGEIASAFAQKLKERNTDFFVMLAGFDAAAPSKPPLYEDEAVFLKTIFNFQFSISNEFSIFNVIDGWVSHSYPNHGFVGTPYDTGRNSIRTYQWELSLLKSLGVTKNLPVFITETGWPHQESQKAKGKRQKSSFYSPEKVAEFMTIAYDIWKEDDRVVGVTPFVFNYPSAPFDVFSWKYPSGDGLYPHYDAVLHMRKQSGEPVQVHQILIETDQDLFLPKELTTNSTYALSIPLRNIGQSILDAADGYEIRADTGIVRPGQYFFSDFSDFEPFSNQSIDLFMKTGDSKGEYTMHAQIIKNKKIIQDLFDWDFTLTGPPSLQVGVQFFPKFVSDADDVQVQIYDNREKLVFQQKKVSIKNAYGLIREVHNVALGTKYRVVLLAPYYLPRQTFVIFRPHENAVVFEKMLPLDFNQDGTFSWADAWSLILRPSLFKLWWVK